MTSPVRVRRHTDGRVAVKLADGPWETVYGWMEERWPSEEEINDSGDWRELLVAELPEPHGYIEMDGAPYWVAGHDTMPSWVAYADGVETETGAVIPAGELRADALKMLAAATASEQHHQEGRLNE